MVYICAVRGCRQGKYLGCGVTFHNLPLNYERRKQWKEILPGKITDGSAICGMHFKPEDYISEARLKPEAVPSVFPTLPEKMRCPICSKLCRSELTLLQHRKYYHSENISADLSEKTLMLNIEPLVTDKSTMDRFQCRRCNEKFDCIDLAKTHIQVEHQSIEPPITVASGQQFCDRCDELIAGLHSCKVTPKCGACSKTMQDRPHFQTHVSKEHAVPVEHFYFPTKNDFLTWHIEMEMQTKFKYRDYKTSLDKSRRTYYCSHREIKKCCLHRCISNFYVIDYGTSVEVFFYPIHSHTTEVWESKPYERFMPSRICSNQTNVDIVKNFSDLYLKLSTILDDIKFESAKLNSEQLNKVYDKALDMALYCANSVKPIRPGMSSMIGQKVVVSDLYDGELNDFSNEFTENDSDDGQSENTNADIKNDDTKNVGYKAKPRRRVKRVSTMFDVKPNGSATPKIINTFSLNPKRRKSMSNETETPKKGSEQEDLGSVTPKPAVWTPNPNLERNKKWTFSDQFSDFIKSMGSNRNTTTNNQSSQKNNLNIQKTEKNHQKTPPTQKKKVQNKPLNDTAIEFELNKSNNQIKAKPNPEAMMERFPQLTVKHAKNAKRKVPDDTTDSEISLSSTLSSSSVKKSPKKAIVKNKIRTKLGKFTPKKRRESADKSLTTSPNSIKIVDYEVKEQENDYNILILKI